MDEYLNNNHMDPFFTISLPDEINSAAIDPVMRLDSDLNVPFIYPDLEVVEEAGFELGYPLDHVMSTVEI